MRTKTDKPYRVNVITLGCSKNTYDSEVLMGQLRANGISVVHESNEKNQVIVINTCGFVDRAKQESVDTILEYAHHKREGRIEKLYVTGCLSERYKDDLRPMIPEVDTFFGTTDLPQLLKTLGADYKHELIGERLLTTPKHYAYLKISEGCDRPCSFCAIPLMRGKHRSIPIEKLVSNAKQLVAQGTKELILIAQDLTYYGLDIYNKRTLATLLIKLAEIEGVHWIRLHYAFPTGFPMDVVDVMKVSDKICSYLDMPLQHCNTEILRSMRRGTTKEKTTQLIHSIRESIPNITLRTTLIVGYPGETDVQFKEMCEWVKQMQFERLGVFMYSHEQDTHAFSLKDDVPTKIKKQRLSTLMNIQKDISIKHNLTKVGTIQRIIIDRKEGEYFVGRSEADSPEVDNEILISAKDTYLSPGNIHSVKIIEADDYDLYGSLL